MNSALIIEDHAVVRMGMKMLLREMSPDMTIKEANSFPEGLDIISNNAVDLIILDISVPGGEETRMVPMLRRKAPLVKILMFSGMDEERFALRYLQAGADGFLPKNASDQEYKSAIKTLLGNEKYVSKSVQQKILTHLSDEKPLSRMSSWHGLSKREMEITKLLVQGLWTKEIAMQLNLKENTISTFKKRIFEKVGVTNPIDLARKMTENNF